jgi:ubiquitin-protein ligase E3 C
MFKQLVFLKNYQDSAIEDMGLMFQAADEDPVTGEHRDVDLIPNGGNIAVTDANKFKYIYMVADFRLN